MSLVSVAVGDDLRLSCILIDTPDTAAYLVPDGEVEVLFKETEVVIGLDPVAGISLSNKIPCEILAVTPGKLLTSLELKGPSGKLHSVISTRSAEALQLAPGKAVWAMIKLNEIMLLPQ